MNITKQSTRRRVTLAGLFIALGIILSPIQASAQWTNGTNINNTNPGHVGIGTDNPTSKLHVHTADTSVVTINSAGSINDGRSLIQLLRTGNTGWDFGLNIALSDDAFTIRELTPSSIAYRFFIQKNTGNVGIGMTAPTSKLSVDGDVHIFGANRRLYFHNGADDPNYFIESFPVKGLAALRMKGTRGVRLADFTGDVLNVDGGNVGIGTTGSLHKLDVAGSVNASNLCIAGICKSNWSEVSGGASQWATIGSNISYNGGRVGIGTASPSYKLHIGGGSIGVQNSGTDATVNVFSGAADESGTFGWSTAGFAYLQSGTWGQGAKNLVIQAGGGNVSIGTAHPPNPVAKLHIQGNVHSSGDITAAGSIAASYQDVAEWVPSEQSLSAGTVVILDVDKTNHVMASTSSYDTKVAGVVSARPGVLLGQGGEGKLMVATTGRVRVKVDATRAPIKIGDLLVTSEVEGMAMKSEPLAVGGRKMHAPGTILGKALEPLDKGIGEVLVLLSLQ